MFVAMLSGKTKVPEVFEDVDYVVRRLDHVPIPDAEPLVRRLERELVPAARVALLVVLQSGEMDAELRIRLRLFATVDRDAVANVRGQAPVDDPAVGGRARFGLTLRREFGLGYVPVARGRCSPSAASRYPRAEPEPRWRAPTTQ
jgi:hypothetical protein